MQVITACVSTAYDPRFLFIWPNSRISVMGGPQAADVLATVKQDEAREGMPAMEGIELDIQKPILDKMKPKEVLTILPLDCGMMAL